MTETVERSRCESTTRRKYLLTHCITSILYIAIESIEFQKESIKVVDLVEALTKTTEKGVPCASPGVEERKTPRVSIERKLKLY